MAKKFSNLVFVDCEAVGPCPSMGILTEIGAVTFEGESFYRCLVPNVDPIKTPFADVRPPSQKDRNLAFMDFSAFLHANIPGRPVFVSDNPAFDWQWINDGFHQALGMNPFGFSARRIGDFYAGLMGDFKNASSWKKLRRTPHTHNPVDDATGNLEAFQTLLERVK